MIRLLRRLLGGRRPDSGDIDEALGDHILDVHRKHPELGKKRLHKALEGEGIHVDRVELKRFLRTHGIGTPPATRQERPSYSRMPHIPWLDYRRKDD